MKTMHYGQNGEDVVLQCLFDKDYKGKFLDVGALDGKHFSNTYVLEQRGWAGVCIEAHPAYITGLKKTRPKSTVIHAAVGNQNKKLVPFYAFKRGSLSTLYPEWEAYFKKKFKCFDKWNVINVPLRTIDRVLENLKIEPPIDVVSMDIEGGEAKALAGFTLSKYMPRILVIEALDNTCIKNTDKIMNKNEYHYARSISNNRFYCKDIVDVPLIRKVQISSTRVQTVHPADVK